MEARLSLCFLCLIYLVSSFNVNAEEETFEQKNPSILDEEARLFGPETSTKIDELFLATDRFRDKRALGLILSGLAQVFGYTVTPVQVASLPNPATNGPTGAPSVQANLAAPVQQQSSPPPTTTTSSTSQTPRQRETIRFTGVVNFGNNSNLYDHLREYERIFHGTTTAPSSSSTTAAPTPSPTATARISSPTKPPLLTPLLVQIPIPIVPNLPPPVIPPADLKLSYPSPFVPVRQREEKVYMKQENKETYSIENKEFGDGREIIRKTEDQKTSPYVNDLVWKQMYEERLAQLERQQKEHAEKLKQQEQQSSQEKDKSREDDINEKYRNREKQVSTSREREHFSRIKEQERNNHNNNDDKDDDDDEEYDLRERYEEIKYKEALKKRPDNEKFHKQKENDDFEDRPNFEHKQLPISEDKRKPEKLRNSYGEILEDEEEDVDGRVSYFDKFQVSSRENDAESSLRNSLQRHKQNLQKIRQEYASPSSKSKYEEYDVDRDTRGRKNNKKKTENDEDETTRKPYVSIRIHGREDYNDYDSSSEKDEEIRRNTPVSSRYVEEQKTFRDESKPEPEKNNGGYDFVTLNPYTLPLRYLYAPTDIKDTKLQNLASDRYKQVENGKDSRSFKETNKNELSPKIAYPERPSGRQLHEGEKKENRHWPAPFDYVFDSTEQTNVVVPNGAQIFANGNHEYTKSTSDAPQTSEEGQGYEGEYEHYLTPVDAPQNPGYSQNYNQQISSETYVPEGQNAAYSKEQIPSQYLDQYRYSIYHDQNLGNHRGTSGENNYNPEQENRNNQKHQVQNLQESKLSSTGQLYPLDYQSSNKDVHGTNQAAVYNYYNPPISSGGIRNLEIIRRRDDESTKTVVNQSPDKIVESTTNTVTGTEFVTAPIRTYYHYDDIDYDPDAENAKVNVTEYKKKIATVTSSEETNFH